MKHPKTTICGIIAMFGTLLTQFFPEYAKIGGLLAALGIGLQGVFSADGKCPDPDCPKNDKNQLKLPLCIVVAFFFVGLFRFLNVL